jgi:hypothetical protein
MNLQNSLTKAPEKTPLPKSHVNFHQNKQILLVFEPEATVQISPAGISIEQFLDQNLTDTNQQENLTELAIEFKLYKFAGQNVEELNESYGKALDNILDVVPNLKILHPIGGHFYLINGVNGSWVVKGITSFDSFGL